MKRWWKNCSMWVDGPHCCPDLWSDCCRKHDEETPWYLWWKIDIELAGCVYASSYSDKLNNHNVQRLITRYIMPVTMWVGLQLFGYIFRPLNKIFKLGW